MQRESTNLSHFPALEEHGSIYYQKYGDLLAVLTTEFEDFKIIKIIVNGLIYLPFHLSLNYNKNDNFRIENKLLQNKYH
mgnify:FL=1